MSKLFLHTTLLFSLLLLTGCSEMQEYAYLKDTPRDTEMEVTNNFDATIYPNDQLYIYVSSQAPEAVKHFNEETNKSTRGVVNGYLVSQSGDIMFPVLGRIHVAGMTRDQLRREIEARIVEGDYVTDPVVTVDLMNFHVAVIGEVKVPRVVPAVGSRLTIFEALAQCGDVTIYGLRTNVLIVRSSDKSQIVDTIDLTSNEVLNSPYYYLQQNDIIYVEPNEKRKKEAWRESDWLNYISLASSFMRVAFVTVYRIVSYSK